MRSALETLYPDRSSYKLSIHATNHGFCRRFKAVLNLARGNDRTLPQSFQTEGRARATLTTCKGGRL